VTNALAWSNSKNLVLLPIDSTMYPNPDLIREQLVNLKGDYSKTMIFLGNLWGISYPTKLISFLDSFRKGGGLVIEDITHKLDLEPIGQSDGWICSLRKWFGTSGLAVLNLNQQSFKANQDNSCIAPGLSGRLIWMQSLNYLPRQSFLRRQIIERLRNSDAILGTKNLVSLAHPKEIERFKHQDWQQIFSSRVRNKIVFEQILNQNLGFQILNTTTDALGCFPTTISISSGHQAIRAFLRQQNIFAANLWPLGQWGEAHPKANDLSKSTLTLPSDQRFSEETCIKIAELINHYQETNKN